MNFLFRFCFLLETIEVIQYPLALNGLPYGVFREFPHYNDKELENHRQSMVTKPRYFYGGQKAAVLISL